MRIVLTTLLMLATTTAWADWIKMSETDTAVIYLDPATHRVDGNLRGVWELHDLKVRDPDGELSRRSLREFDCKGDRLRILSMSTHSGPMATGKLLWSGNDPSQWQYIAPGTSGASLLRAVCGR